MSHSIVIIMFTAYPLVIPPHPCLVPGRVDSVCGWPGLQECQVSCHVHTGWLTWCDPIDLTTAVMPVRVTALQVLQNTSSFGSVW